MKTNKLMTAVALSAMFAACTQDAELNETLAKNDYSNIPMVEADFTADFGVESRMANGFGWEINDKVGLAWLGDGVQISNNQYGFAYQNHPLFCTDTDKKSFKTETMLYVGEYFAYMPYKPSGMAVENLSFSIEEQPLTTNRAELAKQAIYLSTGTTKLEKADNDGNVSEGAQKAGMGNNVKLNLALLNNPATIKFTFKNISDLTDLKVTSVKVDMYDEAVSLKNTVAVKSFLLNGNLTDWTETSNTNFYGNSPATNGSIMLKGEGLAVSNNALTTYALLLPPTEITKGYEKLSLELTTNYGTVTASNVKVDNAKLFTNFGQTATVTAEVDGKNIKKTSAEVKTQAELEEVLNQLAALKQTEAVTIKLQPSAKNDDETFVLTDFTLPEDLKAIVTLTTGDKANNGIVFAGETVIDKQLHVASKVNVTGNMTVEYIDGAVWTLGFTDLTVDHDAVLTNNGVISGQVTTVAADEEKGLGFGKYISNSDKAKMVDGSVIVNNGEAQWIAGVTPTKADGTNPVYAVAESIEEIAAVGKANVNVVRLTDVTIANKAVDWNTELTNIWVVECYGEVIFNMTQDSKKQAKVISFANNNAKLVAKTGSNVRIYSDNKNNAIGVTTIEVEKDAQFAATGLQFYSATVNYDGLVNIWNVEGLNEGTQGENGEWYNTQWH